MPKVLLVARRDSYRIAPYLSAAQRLGIDVLVASNGPNSLIGAVADGLNLDFSRADQALEALIPVAGSAGIDGVVPTDDGTIELTCRVAEALGLRGNSAEAARYSRRKDLARERLHTAGVLTPAHETMAIADASAGRCPACGFPVVLKPLSLSGSRGVIRANDVGEFRAAAKRISAIVADHDDPDTRRLLLIERYVPGVEVAFEGMFEDGELTRLALFDKPEPLEGPYFEESYYVMPSRLPKRIQDRVTRTVASACAAYGLRFGPVHAELRIDGDAVYVIEVAARTIGGQCGRLLSLGTGRSLEEWVLMKAVGMPAGLEPYQGAAGVLMLPTPGAGALRRVEGVSDALRVPGVREVEISLREGAELIPAPEGESYLGFVFATGESAETVERALRRAHACLNIVIGPLIRLRPATSI